MAFSLQHLSGTRKGREERFLQDRIGLGRGRSNQIAFDPELDRTVSARHAEIRVEEGAAVIYDLGSLNGTFVNGGRVRRAVLADGDEIGLGREGPRLRIILRTDRSLAPVEGAERSDTGDPTSLVRVSAATSSGRTTPRSDFFWPFVVTAVLVVGLAIGGFVLFKKLDQRISSQQQPLPAGGGPQATGPVRTAETEATAALLLKGISRAAEGPERTVDLGGAVLVEARGAATLSTVLEQVLTFFGSHPDAKLFAFPDGRADLAREVIGYRRGPELGEHFDGEGLVLLELAPDPSNKAVPVTIGATTSVPGRVFRVRRPGFGPQQARGDHAKTFAGVRPDDPQNADLLGIDGLVDLPGSPVFDAETGDLAGIVLGSRRPQLALAARHLAVLRAAPVLEAPVSPLRK